MAVRSRFARRSRPAGVRAKAGKRSCVSGIRAIHGGQMARMNPSLSANLKSPPQGGFFCLVVMADLDENARFDKTAGRKMHPAFSPLISSAVEKRFRHPWRSEAVLRGDAARQG
jgi:hypothetical protein